MSGDRRI
jgi:hypothetical protein